MRQFVLLMVFLLAVSFIPHKTFAQTALPSSATLIPTNAPIQKIGDTRVVALQHVLRKYNSPLAPYAQTYVSAADKYGVDWKLLPSISGLESTFGQHLLSGTYNAYGWGGGYIYFKSWEDGILTINKTIKENYMNKWGATDVWSIGPIYAESPTWSVRVNSFMNEINREYLSLENKIALTPNL